jgi:RNA polymerase sigma-70 factor (ECF subfamily)
MVLDNSGPLRCFSRVRRTGWDQLLAERKLSAEDVRGLYERHGPALLVYACSFVVDAALAEDVVHQVFVKVLQGQTSIPEAPLAYLYRAVRNTALNARRNGLRKTALDADSPLFVHRGGDRETALALQAALAELAEDQREAVVMKIWSGMTLEEVAAATGVSPNTAASRYRYGLQKLRERLKPFRKS